MGVNRYMKELGQKIKQLRKRNELTQRMLGDKIGVTVSYISKLENGIDKPNLTMLSKIAEALGVEIGEFFDTHEPPAELKDVGADWIVLGEELEGQGITPDQIREWAEMIKKLRDVE